MCRLPHKAFDERKNNEAYKHAQVKERPDSQDSAHVKIGDMNPSGIFFFFYQQIGNKKTAQDKEEVYAQVAILKEALNVVECIGTGVLDVVEKSHVRMVQEHQEK